jgi:hypothetical protein
MIKYLALFLILSLAACTTATTGQAAGALGRPSMCTDTDGGIDFETPGTVSVQTNIGGNAIYTDDCQGKTLIEYYCDKGNFARIERTTCTCSFGACV